MPATPSVVDVRAASTNTSSVALAAFSPTPVANGVILVCVGTYLGVAASQHLAPTDNFSNTYTQVGTGIDQANVSLSLWRARAITTGASHQVTVHAGVAANMIGMAWALDVADEVNTDFTSATLTVGSTPAVGPSSPAPAANSIFLAFLGTADTPDHGVPTSWNAQGVNGFTAAMQASGRAFLHLGFFAPNLFGAYLISSTVQTATWVNAIATTPAVAVMISVKPFIPPDPLAAMTWYPTFPDFVPHRRSRDFWYPNDRVDPPEPPYAAALFPARVPHRPLFSPRGGEVSPSAAVTIPIPDLLRTLTFFPVYPSTVPHRRLRAALLPSLFAPPLYIATAGIPWLPTYPHRVPHRLLRAALMPSLAFPPQGQALADAASLAWQARYPDTVPHRRSRNLGGFSYVERMSASTGTVPPGICLSLQDVAVTRPHLTSVVVQQSTLGDATVTSTTLTTVEIC
jgi:hypothetical protein